MPTHNLVNYIIIPVEFCRFPVPDAKLAICIARNKVTITTNQKKALYSYFKQRSRKAYATRLQGDMGIFLKINLPNLGSALQKINHIKASVYGAFTHPMAVTAVKLQPNHKLIEIYSCKQL